MNEWQELIIFYKNPTHHPPPSVLTKEISAAECFPTRKWREFFFLFIEISAVNWKGANRRDRRKKYLCGKEKKIPWNRIRNWTRVAEPKIFNGAENVSTQCRQHNEAFRRKLLGFQLTASLLPFHLSPLFFTSLSIYIEHLKKTYSYLPQNQSW